MKVVHAAAEVAPFCVTGGLGEVLAALPAAQRRAEAEVAVIVPCCRAAGRLELEDTGANVGLDARLLTDGNGLYFVDAPHYFDRAGLYADDAGPYADELERFEFFAQAVAAAAPRVLGADPDIIHAHDWHAGLVPGLIDPTVFTIHNLTYQGEFPAVGVNAGTADYVRDGSFNFMRGAIARADRVTTVSPTYAAEIQTPELGEDLDRLLAARGVTGILNGLDLSGWDPATNPALVEPYDAAMPGGKAANRESLLAEFGFDAGADDLVIGVVSRFAHQKGIDIIAALAPRLSEIGAVLIALGGGDTELEELLVEAAAMHPRELTVVVGWDLDLAHRIIAGSDVVAVPSRFEPCGLIQMQAMRYGAIPVVHAVGGLADTVVDPGDQAMSDRGTGFAFSPLTVDNLAEALDRAATLRHDTASWERLVTRVMKADWSWDRSASEYLELYETL